MIQYILSNVSSWLSHNSELLDREEFKILSQNIKQDLDKYQFIDFYAVDAKAQLKDKMHQIKGYQKQLLDCQDMVLDKIDNPSNCNALLEKINIYQEQMASKLKKVIHYQEIIPQGMLDIKRILYLKESSDLSFNHIENNKLLELIKEIHQAMIGFNKNYTILIKKGAPEVDDYFKSLTIFYWQSIEKHQKGLLKLKELFGSCNQLTKCGLLAIKCVNNAIRQFPKDNIKIKLRAISQTNKSISDKLSKNNNFLSKAGVSLCKYLSSTDRPFFYVPSSADCYHIDYNPNDDFANTGGNCFGEFNSFLQYIKKGSLKLFCPETNIINYQLDQSRSFSFGKKTLGQSETNIHHGSKHQHVQWNDVRNLFINNPKFEVGSICGMHFSMNPTTKSNRSFTAGHIAAIAKLDQTKSPYKYLVFEKDFGIFGISRDEDLGKVFQTISDLYRGMNYGILKLVKYGNVTKQTYDLVGSIAPLQTTIKKGFAI